MLLSCQVLAKILVDSFQLRLVDLAAVLTMAECMLAAQEACSCYKQVAKPKDTVATTTFGIFRERSTSEV